MTTITLVNEQNSTGNFSAHMLREQRAIQEITYELLQSQQHLK